MLSMINVVSYDLYPTSFYLFACGRYDIVNMGELRRH
jgi:hypothetical protein